MSVANHLVLDVFPLLFFALLAPVQRPETDGNELQALETGLARQLCNRRTDVRVEHVQAPGHQQFMTLLIGQALDQENAGIANLATEYLRLILQARHVDNQETEWRSSSSETVSLLIRALVSNWPSTSSPGFAHRLEFGVA